MSVTFAKYLERLNRNRAVLLTLIVDDFQGQYRGALLGVFWALLRPLAFIGAIWFVITTGFKGSDMVGENVPFILYLLCGYLPWLLFIDSVNGSMNSLVSNRFLLQQATFQPSLFPLIKFGSAIFLHLIFLVLLFIVLIAHGHYPTIYWLQVPLLMLLLFLLVLGIGWFTSSLRLFSTDVSQVVAVILQVGFWLTPIFWSLSLLPERLKGLASLNPMAFVIEGYRDALLRSNWIWERPDELVIYLATCAVLCLIGGMIFRRLRPHFGEMV